MSRINEPEEVLVVDAVLTGLFIRLGNFVVQ